MNTPTLKVLIVGGGMGGLCLAQGLKKEGVACKVFERDATPNARSQGFRININPDGSAALHACLPPKLFDAFAATCGDPNNRFAFATEQLEELLAINRPEPDAATVRAFRSVSRITLRQILLHGLDDVVHFGKRLIRYEQSDKGVTVHFEDGTSATGDILVGADGVNSRVREQFLPHATPISTNVFAIAAKIALDESTRKLLSPDCLAGACVIQGPKGRAMFVARHEFRNSPKLVLDGIGSDGSASDATGLLTDNSADYAFWGFMADRSNLIASDRRHMQNGSALDKMTPVALRDYVLKMIDGWHPRLKQLVCDSDLSTLTTWPMRTAAVIKPWSTTNITLIGDAIHSMPPTGGIGGNTALRDADLLADRLAAANRGEMTLTEAVQQYEQQMFRYAFDAVRESTGRLRDITSTSTLKLATGRTFFRTIDKLPALKRKIFEQ